MIFAKRIARRKPGRTPKRLSGPRFAAYLSWLDRTGSHELSCSACDVRLPPEVVQLALDQRPSWRALADRARSLYAARLVTGIEQSLSQGVEPSEAHLEVLRANAPQKYPRPTNPQPSPACFCLSAPVTAAGTPGGAP